MSNIPVFNSISCNLIPGCLRRTSILILSEICGIQPVGGSNTTALFKILSSSTKNDIMA